MVDGYDRQSEGAVRITSNTLSPKGKEDFTEAVLNTEDIRKQRFTFASSKRNGHDRNREKKNKNLVNFLMSLDIN
jgi:hypothetical protein